MTTLTRLMGQWWIYLMLKSLQMMLTLITLASLLGLMEVVSLLQVTLTEFVPQIMFLRKAMAVLVRLPSMIVMFKLAMWLPSVV